MDNSLKVWTVWDDDKLVGLARVVGDGCTIIYIQDVLVLESYQGQGIGSELIKLILEKYKKVRQVVLMTDETEKTVKFYKKSGLVNITKVYINNQLKGYYFNWLFLNISWRCLETCSRSSFYN